jgi:hypothetical protein
MEIWKNIEGYEGLYQISNLGRVKLIKSGKIINSTLGFNKYYLITLRKNGKPKSFRLHRLICQSFIDNLENKPYVNHKNGIKTDNSLENLEWCTPRENIIHAKKLGLMRYVKQENHGSSKLTKKDVYKIKYELSHINSSKVAKIFKISISNVSRIRNNILWKDV